MRRILKSFQGSRKFFWLFALVLLYPITNPCDAIGVFFGLDNNEPPCNTFALTNVTGVPFGPVYITWTTVQGAIGYRITVWGGGAVIGQADVGPDATSATVNLDQAGVAQGLQAGMISVWVVANTGVADPPLCEAAKNFPVSVQMMSKKSTLPPPTANVCQAAAPNLPCNCNGFCDAGESYYTCPQDCHFAPVPAAVCIQVRGDCSGGGTCCSGLTCKQVGRSKRCEP